MAKQVKFEDQMNRLKQIVDLLEKQDSDLDESISLYEEGLKLSKALKEELSKFEDKIESLKGEDNE